MASINIVLSQLNYHTGNFKSNTEKIVSEIHAAKSQGADLIVFSELCVCGYPPRDFLEFEDFINRSMEGVMEIARHCIGIAAIVGAPVRNPITAGKDLYNAALLLENGEIKATQYKALLPNYDIFDEYRYFEPGRDFKVIEMKGVRLALTICEDLWNINDNPMYILNPMDELIKQHPDVIINIAASPYSKDQIRARKQVLTDNAKKYGIPLLYCNLTGAQTQLIFDGGSMVVNANGDIADERAYFQEDRAMYLVETSDKGTEVKLTAAKHNVPSLPDIGFIRNALVMGIREYFNKQFFTKAILGLSGGIDSAVVLALAAEALGPENVRAVLLPSRYSSEHSIDDSLEMVKLLGVKHDIIPIEKTFNALEETLALTFNGLPFDLTEENMQSRSRGVILMAMSNKFGYILLNTSNKSELAVGYGTLYGDMCGGLSVIGDLFKTQVYELAHYLNSEHLMIPEQIISKPPSAELRPDQKDSDSLPDYELLDEILKLYIEDRKSPAAIAAICGNPSEVNRVLGMVNRNEWKRLQAPPVLRVSSKAFGPGRRVPIVAKYLN